MGPPKRDPLPRLPSVQLWMDAQTSIKEAVAHGPGRGIGSPDFPSSPYSAAVGSPIAERPGSLFPRRGMAATMPAKACIACGLSVLEKTLCFGSGKAMARSAHHAMLHSSGYTEPQSGMPRWQDRTNVIGRSCTAKFPDREARSHRSSHQSMEIRGHFRFGNGFYFHRRSSCHQQREVLFLFSVGSVWKEQNRMELFRMMSARDRMLWPQQAFTMR